MRLKIISEQSEKLNHFKTVTTVTSVINKDTGEILEDVLSVRWEIDSTTMIPIAVIEMYGVEIDADVEDGEVKVVEDAFIMPKREELEIFKDNQALGRPPCRLPGPLGKCDVNPSSTVEKSYEKEFVGCKVKYPLDFSTP